MLQLVPAILGYRKSSCCYVNSCQC